MPSGNGGQQVLIVPSRDLVVLFTGGAANAASTVHAMLAGALLPSLLIARGKQGRQ